MRRELIIMGTLISLLFSNCTSDNKLTQDERQVANSDQIVNDIDVILLNDGKKWKVNEEMLPHIDKSELVFRNFEGEDYQALAEEMMNHTNNLIQSCTMEGKSYDELHKWLHPHIEMIKSLKESKDVAVGNKIYTELNKSFGKFHKYFE
jgi:hypothetical protein